MRKFSYIGGKVVKIGGRTIAAASLTTLDSKTLQVLIDKKVIKEENGETKEKRSSEKRIKTKY